MARIGIETLNRTEEELNGAEMARVNGAGPWFFPYASPLPIFAPQPAFIPPAVALPYALPRLIGPVPVVNPWLGPVVGPFGRVHVGPHKIKIRY